MVKLINWPFITILSHPAQAKPERHPVYKKTGSQGKQQSCKSICRSRTGSIYSQKPIGKHRSTPY
jgi:hypothetical protein